MSGAMEAGSEQEQNRLDLDDPNLEEKLVNELKAQGVFDQFRKDCLSDVDTKVGRECYMEGGHYLSGRQGLVFIR